MNLKYGLVLFTVVLLIGLVYSAEMRRREDLFNVMLDNLSYDAGSIAILTVENNSPYEITYGEEYKLFKYDENGVETSVLQNDVPFVAVAHVVPAWIGRSTQKIDISHLEPGNYRIIKVIYPQNSEKNPHTYTIEFKITN